jgi:hypothetical protein
MFPDNRCEGVKASALMEAGRMVTIMQAEKEPGEYQYRDIPN